MLTKKSLFTARYYETGQFKEGERGTRVVFSWAKIIGQYVFWFGSFYAQYQIYSWICKQRIGNVNIVLAA
ncbi:hypothetical protein ANCDUO_02534 [Ancylostoma duodenale]|uniref:Uncharacterized protein n=1 Tax=Ancylostoma duodenale TaxID=51022 RepID=A0A0C2DBG2_9BILA|nr:hypothetical protein ANCDUO_02534 [Ancylostoma duodenale]